MDQKNLKNADLIRSVAEEHGFYHSNKFIKDYILAKFKRKISVQQVAQVLGRYRDRQSVDASNAHHRCRSFLLACHNDINLAKKILAGYGGAL